VTSTDKIFKLLRQFLSGLPKQPRLYVAYSGGVDSCVLLHALNTLRGDDEFTLHAFHVHHGLNAAADDWVLHCQQTCQAWEIPINIHYLQDKAEKGESIEAWARERRRAIFRAYLDRDDNYVVTAQHLNDQAETALLQLFRGSGSHGLAAMPALTPLASGFLARPLLQAGRRDIVEYAERHQLRWVEDSSNQQLQFDRNYLRQQIWPLISQRWPSAAVTISRSAELMARQNRVVDGYCARLLDEIGDTSKQRLKVAALAGLDQDTQLLVLRYWLRYWGLLVPSSRRLLAGLAMLLSAGASANPSLAWDNNRISRYRDFLYLHRPLPELPAAIAVRPGDVFFVEGIGHFRLQAGFPGFRCDASARLEIRFRHGGERLALHRSGPHRALKKLLQDWGVLPWLRQRVPLLYHDDNLLAVADLAIAAEYQAPSAEHSYCLCRLPNDSRSVLHFAYSDFKV